MQYKTNNVQLSNADCIDYLSSLGDASVDLIATDPPYFKVKALSWDRQWSTKSEFLDWLEKVVVECARVLKSTGSLYLFCSPYLASETEMMIARHFRVLNHIVWRKTAGKHNRCNKESLRKYFPQTERIIFAESLKAPAWNNGKKPVRRHFSVTKHVPFIDVWDFKVVHGYKGKHPCEKPAAMMEHIVLSSSQPGDTVLDIFSGAGTTAIAAQKLGRKFIG